MALALDQYPVPPWVSVSSESGLAFQASVVDITPRGVYVRAREALPPGSQVVLTFLPNGGEPLVAHAVVERAVAGGLGFQVVAPTPAWFAAVLADWSGGKAASPASAMHAPPYCQAEPEPEVRLLEPLEVVDVVATGERPRLEGLEVLVIDDDPDVRALLTAGLSRFGATVKTAANARLGLSALRGGHAACVLLDWLLPSGSGESALKEIKKAFPWVPIAVISGVVRARASHAEIRRYGAEVVFTKPFNLEELVQWISKAGGDPPFDVKGV